jgi:hypothetical protein
MESRRRSRMIAVTRAFQLSVAWALHHTLPTFPCTAHLLSLSLSLSLFLIFSRLATNEARVNSQTPNQTIYGRSNWRCLLLQIQRQRFSMDQSHPEISSRHRTGAKPTLSCRTPIAIESFCLQIPSFCGSAPRSQPGDLDKWPGSVALICLPNQ